LKIEPKLTELGVGLPPPMSAEEEQLSSLFMSEKESGLTFKVEDKMIPAHKKVLIRKCKFFANLFNSKQRLLGLPYQLKVA